MFSLSGKRPGNLGVKGGRLTPCPSSPNCVCSQDGDKVHGIAPLTYKGEAAAAWQRLQSLVAGMQGASVTDVKPDYLRAEFKSGFFGFVDDVEFLAQAPGTIHVRSASRLGKADFGVNRKRVEAIRAAFGG